MSHIPHGLREPLACLAVVIVFGQIFGDVIDRVAIALGLTFALSMSGQEGLES